MVEEERKSLTLNFSSEIREGFGGALLSSLASPIVQYVSC